MMGTDRTYCPHLMARNDANNIDNNGRPRFSLRSEHEPVKHFLTYISESCYMTVKGEVSDKGHHPLYILLGIVALGFPMMIPNLPCYLSEAPCIYIAWQMI